VRAILVGAALALAGVLSAPVVRADSVEQARMYFDAGAQAYTAGRYAVAIEAFDEAYRLSSRPSALFSLAQAERKQFWVDKKPEGLSRALGHYRAYLTAVPEGGRRDDATSAIAELEPVQARLGGAVEVAAPGAQTDTRLLVSSQAINASASIDGAGAAPLPRIAPLTPGKHHVLVVADGYFDDERDITILPGVTTPMELNLKEKPGLLNVETESGATILVDGREGGTTPQAHPLEVPSGKHTVAVSRNGRQLWKSDVTLERGKTRSIIVRLDLSRQRRISFVVLGASAVGVVAGAVFIGVSVAQQSSAESIKSQRAVSNITASQLASYNGDLTARAAWRSASLATFGASAAVLATGGALFLFDRPTGGKAEPSFEPAPRPATPVGCGCGIEISAIPMVGPGFGGAGVLGRF
jgi:PEGA domain